MLDKKRETKYAARVLIHGRVMENKTPYMLPNPWQIGNEINERKTVAIIGSKSLSPGFRIL